MKMLPEFTFPHQNITVMLYTLHSSYCLRETHYCIAARSIGLFGNNFLAWQISALIINYILVYQKIS